MNSKRSGSRRHQKSISQDLDYKSSTLAFSHISSSQSSGKILNSIRICFNYSEIATPPNNTDRTSKTLHFLTKNYVL